MLKELDDRDWVVLARLAQSGPGVDFVKILDVELDYVRDALMYNNDDNLLRQLQGRAQALRDVQTALASAQDQMARRNGTV